jgi:hypothetical protein
VVPGRLILPGRNRPGALNRPREADMTDHSQIIARITKLLALSRSANQHEAAAALAKAQALMSAYDITKDMMDAADISSVMTKAGATVYPAEWEARLARLIAHAFGCKHLFDNGDWEYLGIDPAPKLAVYTFACLIRQARRARSDYIKQKCKRLSISGKTRRADLFSGAWVQAVANQVHAFARPTRPDKAIAAYIKMHYGDLEDLTTRDRQGNKNLRGNDHKALADGLRAGKGVTLNQGVGGGAASPELSAPILLIEGH